MRVTIVVPGLNLSGGIRVIAIYAARLRELGHHVTVVSPMAPIPTVKEQLKSLIRKFRPVMVRGHNPTHFDSMRVPVRVLERPGPVTAADVPDADVIVGCFWVVARWISTFPPEKGVKVHFIQGYETIPGVDSTMLDEAWRLPMKKIVVSGWLAEMARVKFGDAGARIVPNGVDSGFFTAPPRAKNAELSIGFIHGEDWCKAPEVAIEACRMVAQMVPSVRVIVFGGHPPVKNLIPGEWAPRWNPPQEAIPGLYARCDAWIWPSRQEGFGLPILEAMACRTPVIGARVGAAPELLAEGRGILVDADDPRAFADAVLRIHRMPARDWEAMSQAAWEYARRQTWDLGASLFEKALVEAAAGE